MPRANRIVSYTEYCEYPAPELRNLIMIFLLALYNLPSFKNVWRFSSRSTSKIFSTPVLRGFDSEFANKVLNLCYLYL